MTPKVSAADLTGLLAIIPTPALPEAHRWDAEATVDLAETSRTVEALLADGADGVIALGTTGECPTLPAGEYEALVRCLVETVDGRVPLFIGATTTGAYDTFARMDVLRRAGADGTLLGLPMWQPLTERAAVDYYAQASHYFPDLAVMVYANQRAFRFPFADATGFWKGVADSAPTVVAAKCSRPGALSENRRVTRHRVNFLPSDMVLTRFRALGAEETTAFWATAASMGPQPCLALRDALAAGDETSLDDVSSRILWAAEPFLELAKDDELFASYNLQLERIRINAAGYCRSGPIRPPYSHVPDKIAAVAVESARRWRTLVDHFG
jgi:dihydrodipicolinate synthase/N-acetylneuraminate lyase